MKHLVRQLMNEMSRHVADRIQVPFDVQKVQILLGGLHADRVRKLPLDAPLQEAEFRVFSQSGEDGILQRLVHLVPLQNDTFVEFGVEDYREANTRFLLLHDNWRGVVLDSDPQNVAHIKADSIFWRHDLQAFSAHVTAENINGILSDAGVRGDIGLLSIDIDGNDYWIWNAIEGIQPRIVVCEFNSVFGWERAITIPYSPDFNVTRAHFSFLYFGASLKALCHLAERKGYVFVGCESSGANAFFVRRDVAQRCASVSCQEPYVESRFRLSRDQEGRLTFVSGAQRRELIAGLPVVDVESNQVGTVA